MLHRETLSQKNKNKTKILWSWCLTAIETLTKTVCKYFIEYFASIFIGNFVCNYLSVFCVAMYVGVCGLVKCTGKWYFSFYFLE